MSKSNTVLITGIVSGVATIYAYNRGFSVDRVITKIEENNEVVGEFIRNLYELSLDLLTKIYATIVKFVEEVIFKTRLKLDDMRLK